MLERNPFHPNVKKRCITRLPSQRRNGLPQDIVRFWSVYYTMSWSCERFAHRTSVGWHQNSQIQWISNILRTPLKDLQKKHKWYISKTEIFYIKIFPKIRWKMYTAKVSHKFGQPNIVPPLWNQHFKKLKRYLNVTRLLEKDVFSSC